jgi:ABC-type sugar transport system permease subunit
VRNRSESTSPPIAHGIDTSHIVGRVRLIGLWHAVGVVASIGGLMLARGKGTKDDLAGLVKAFMSAFFVLATIGHAASAIGVNSLRRWGRTASLVTNYLVLVVVGAATLNQCKAFQAIGDLGEGLYKGIVPFLVAGVGLLWVLLAGQMRAKAPTANGPKRLRIAGWSVAAAAGAWFVVAAGPGGMLDELSERIVQPVTVASAAITIASAMACRVMWSRAAAAHFGTAPATDTTLAGLAFLSPNLLGFAAFFVGPLLFSLIMSLTDAKTSAGTLGQWVGLDNYVKALSLDFASAPQANAGVEVLKPGYQVLAHLDVFGQNWVIGARDIEFWKSLRNISIFLVLAVPLAVLPALVLSSILSSKLRGMKIFRAIYFIPSVAGVIGVSLVWRQMFDSTIGWINYLTDLVGLSEAGKGQPWLSDSSTALSSMVVVFAWMNFGFNTVLYLAGHQAIPKELYEAAEIDGASTWQTFKRITVPQLRNTTFYVLITTSILALQLFDIVFVLSQPEPGGPDNATTTPVLALYEEAFSVGDMGYASALAWVLFLLIFAFTFVQFRQQRDEATSGGVS